MHFQVNNSKLGVRIPGNSLVKELLSSACLRLTMNQWFSHGQSVASYLPPEQCCSACMTKCLAENECRKCQEKLNLFQPFPTVVPQSNPLTSLTSFMSRLKLNENTPIDTPPYDLNNLAEALIGNLLECKGLIGYQVMMKCSDLGSFRSFLDLFSLGDQVTADLLVFIKSNLKDLIEPQFDQMKITSVELSCSSDDSNENSCDTSSTASDEYFDKDSETPNRLLM